MRNQQQTRHLSVVGIMRQEIGATARHLIAATLLSVVISALVVEGVSVALTGTVPALPTHLAAGVVAVALGYAVAITVLFRAVLRGIGRGAGWVTSEFEVAAERVLHDGSPRVSSERGVHAMPTPPFAASNPTGAATMLEDGVIAGIRSN